MWPDFRKHSAGFKTAVLTGRDAEGYPFSVRCVPSFDDARQVVRIAPVAGAEIAPGPANLLFHSHDEQLWDLKMVQVLGTLDQSGEEWVFRPERLVGGGNSLWQAVQMIAASRRSAREYLAKRGLPRPRISWDRIRSLYPPKASAATAKRVV